MAWCGCASWAHNILTTVMTNIVVDKSADHAKPLSPVILFAQTCSLHKEHLP